MQDEKNGSREEPKSESARAQHPVSKASELRCEFLRVPQLSALLGISANSIHSQMRLGIFPIPHRRIGNVIVVKKADYQNWFDSEHGQRQRPPRARAGRPAPRTSSAAGEERMLPPATIKMILGRETSKERRERERGEG